MAYEEGCCFTGYRPAKFPFEFTQSSQDYLRFENKLFEAILSLASEGCETFYSGVAMGFDLVAAELVLLCRSSGNCGARLVCVVPYKGQQESWPNDWQQRHSRVLSQADEVVYLSEKYFAGCFQKRNEYMVDNSGVLLTYYDGKKGGTGNTVHYAKRRGLPIINIADDGVHEQIGFPAEVYVVDSSRT